jgi:hypothetical protein
VKGERRKQKGEREERRVYETDYVIAERIRILSS